MRTLVLGSLVCGIAACGAARPVSAPAPRPPVAPAEPSSSAEPPAAIGPPSPHVDALAPRFSLDVAQPEDGGVHHCLFLLDDGRPLTWTCYGRHALASTQTMWTDRGEATRALVVAVDDWGTTLGSDEPDAPITLTSWAAADAVVRTGAQPESEPVALRALREALMSVAQDELAHVRQAEEECSGCPSEAYCQNTESCSTFGSDEKDCAVFRVCTPRHPAGSECMHDYECRSRGCSGRDELYGRCD